MTSGRKRTEYSFQARGERELKGITARVAVFEVLVEEGAEPESVSSDVPVGHLPLRPRQRSAPRFRKPRPAVLAAGTLLLALLSLGLGTLLRYAGSRDSAAAASPAPSVSREHSIAVLPFHNLSADPENEYFSDGITEEILNALARVQGLKVPARTSSFQFQGQNADVREVAEKLGVAHVLEGSVRRSGSRVRITAQLIDAQDGYRLWSETYDRELADVFAIQEEIARAIVSALEVRLGMPLMGGTAGTSAPLVKAGTRDPEAYRFFLRARYLMTKVRWEQAAYERVLANLEQAIARDPSFAQAYAGVALVYIEMARFGNRDENFRRAKAAAQRAIELDPLLATAHALLGYIAYRYEWDFATAERMLRQATELDPASPGATTDYGAYLVSQGRFDEGFSYMRKAIELDPLVPWWSYSLGTLLIYARRYEEAIGTLRELDDLDPDARVRLWLSMAYSLSGRPDLAEAERRKVLQEAGGAQPRQHRDLLAAVNATLGHTREARDLLQGLEHTASGGLDSASGGLARSVLIAWAYTALGEHDAAFQWLEHAYQTRERELVDLKVIPGLDPLRSDPRFPALLRKVGLERDRAMVHSTNHPTIPSGDERGETITSYPALRR